MAKWSWGLAVLLMVSCSPPDDVIKAPVLNGPDIQVLDGDTLVVDGQLVRLTGIDAPELGPWARCWAEAALAGHAKAEVERHVFDPRERGRWKVSNPTAPDSQGRVQAQLVRDDGEDLADILVVYGYAARSSTRWDWCHEGKVRPSEEDDPLPHGPNLWYPTGKMFDARAGD